MPATIPGSSPGTGMTPKSGSISSEHALLFTRSASPMYCRALRQHDLACFKQRLEVGENARPAARHGVDELRFISVHRVRDGQFYGVACRLNLDNAPRIALGLHFRPELVAPPGRDASAHRSPRFLQCPRSV